MALTTSQYNSIMRQYDEAKISCRRELEERQKEVYAKIPRYRELENEISAETRKSTMAAILDEDGNAEQIRKELKAKIEALTEEMKKLLTDASYPADYLDPIYQCKDCKDTGFINNEKCHCFLAKETETIFGQSYIHSVLMAYDLSQFQLEYYSTDTKDPVSHLSSYASAEKGLQEAKAFIESFSDRNNEEPAPNLLIYGDTGTGKTLLSNCIAGELLKKGVSVLYFTAFQFIELAEKYTFQHKDDLGSVKEEFENVFNVDLLILDDLGTEFSNSFTSSQIFQLINERAVRNRSTILTTNLSFQRLNELYSERVFSRTTSNYNPIKLFGSDIRLLKKFNTTQ